VKIRLLILLLVCFGTAKAQQGVGGFLHVTGGLSFPSGDFQNTDPNNPAAGYARTGFTINALLGHKIYKQFGAFAMLSFTAHRTNSQAIENGLNQQASSYKWKAKQDLWTVTGFTFGPQFSQNFKKMAVDFRLAAGVLNFISPNLALTGTSINGGPAAKYTMKNKRASAGILGGGITLKYEVKRSWVILANADLFIANPLFSDVEEVTEIEGQDPIITYTTFRQEFKMAQFGLGIGYVF